jgi:uncharacterized protein YjbI with pentapeptide repeats
MNLFSSAQAHGIPLSSLPYLVIGAGLAATIITWWSVPIWQVRQLPMERRTSDAANEFRKILTPVAIAVTFFLSVALICLQAQLIFRQKQVETRGLSLQINKTSLANQQLADGLEKVLSDNSSIRLAGIYALEDTVLNGSSQHRSPAITGLLSLIKRSCSWPQESGQEMPADLRAAIDVLRDAWTDSNHGPVRLSGCHLSKVNLSEANLSGADFSGADLSGANLQGTNLSKSNLSGANLSMADLSPSKGYTKANLSGADLSGADLSGAVLVLANLERADLSRAKSTYSNFSSANLTGANLSAADLSHASLFDASVDKALLSGALLTQTHLAGDRKAQMQWMHEWAIRFSPQTASRFLPGNYSAVDEHWVMFHGAIFSDLSRVDLSSTDVAQRELDEACGDEATKLPPGLTIRPCKTVSKP